MHTSGCANDFVSKDLTQQEKDTESYLAIGGIHANTGPDWTWTVYDGTPMHLAATVMGARHCALGTLDHQHQEVLLVGGQHTIAAVPVCLLGITQQRPLFLCDEQQQQRWLSAASRFEPPPRRQQLRRQARQGQILRNDCSCSRSEDVCKAHKAFRNSAWVRVPCGQCWRSKHFSLLSGCHGGAAASTRGRCLCERPIAAQLQLQA